MSLLDGISPMEELALGNQRVFVRADVDAPLGARGEALVVRKLKALLPTLKLAMDQEARVIIAAHRDHPSRASAAWSMEEVGAKLSELSGWEVFLPDDCLGDAVKRVIGDLRAGQVCLLENLRFQRGEIAGDESFARALAGFFDIYVNDALACCLDQHASVSVLPRLIPMRGAGLLLQKELGALGRLGLAAEHPYVGVLGGPANSAQLDLLELLLTHADHVCVGGAVALTFLGAAGSDLADTLVAPELMARCRSLLDKHRGRLSLPVDLRTATHAAASPQQVASTKRVPSGRVALDIGPETYEAFAKTIAPAKTIVYTGLMGAALNENAMDGTLAVLAGIASCPGFSVVLGDESALAVTATEGRLADDINHISLGSAASLAALAGLRLPGVDALRGASNE